MKAPNAQSPRDAALAYASAGFPVFPCRQDKRPLVSGGFKSATSDPAKVAEYWDRWPDALIGMPTGERSGIFALDLDIDRDTGEHVGEVSLAAAGLAEVLDGAIEVRTPSGGRHFYFRHDGGLRNSAGRLGHKIDVRGEGGYVCVPGSGGYRWAGNTIFEREVPSIPSALLDALAAPKIDATQEAGSNVVQLSPMQTLAQQLARPASPSNAWAAQAMNAEIGRVMAAGEGERNHTLNRAAFSLGQIVAGEGLDRAAAEAALMRAGRAIGLDEDEITKTIASGLTAGAAEPRTAPERAQDRVQAFAQPDPATVQNAVSERAAGLLARMVRGSDIKADLNRRHVVKRWLYADTLGVTYGAPGSSKSFFVLDLLRHVVSGEDWRGNRVRQAPVLYIAGEGAAGIFNRVVAAGGAGEGFVFLPALVDLCSNEIDARAIVEAFRALAPETGMPGAIVIDTLARAMGGGDENASQDMGRLIRHADLLRELTGAHVHLVHHSGKDIGKGARGHSSLLGALDTEIHVEELDDGVRLATITKQKDGEEGLTAAYTLARVDLGTDLDGEIVSSCRVEVCDVPEKGDAAKLTAEQRRVLDALREFITDHGVPNPGGAGWPEIGARKTVDLAMFKAFAAAREPDADEPAKANRRVRDMLKKLHGHGITCTNEGRIWIVPKGGDATT